MENNYTTNINNYTTTTTMDKNLNMMSLFDYLGRAAGPNLGLQVSRAAAQNNISVETRLVSNKKYTGPVLLYPKYFLDNYFSSKEEKLPF